MASIGGVDLPRRHQDTVPPAPAEADRADLAGPRDLLDVLDEALNQRQRDALAVCGEPGAERRGDGGRVLGFVDQAGGLLVLEGRLDVLQEGDGQGVSLVHVRDVGVEAGGGVVVGEEADVGEFVAEDCRGGELGLALVGFGTELDLCTAGGLKGEW